MNKYAICYPSLTLPSLSFTLQSLFSLAGSLSSLFHLVNSVSILTSPCVTFYHIHDHVEVCLSSSAPFHFLCLCLIAPYYLSLSSSTTFFSSQYDSSLNPNSLFPILGHLSNFPFFFGFLSGSLSLFIMSLSSSPPPYLI